MSGTISFKMISDSIGELVLSQPNRRNALNAAMWKSLPERLNDAEQEHGLKVLIIRGDGEHFAAGADISEFSTLYETPETSADISMNIANAMKALAAFPLPTLAMIRGACVGGGCALALCCDIRFADNTAQFGVTPARLGLVYPYEDISRLIETIGISNAKDMILSTRLIKAKEAKKMGLVNFRHKVDTLEKFVMAYAQTQTALSAQSLRTMKQMFSTYQAGQRGDNQHTHQWFLDGFSSDDFKEGYAAFMEKRKPDFK